MTHIYLAYNSLADLALASWDWEARPANILVANPYVSSWSALLARAPQVRPARRMLDSGAYSAWKSGHTVDIEELIARSKDPAWTETVGLDVIGSAEGSRRNADYMQAQGSPAMPVFHYGDPWELLDHYVKGWPKVGLSCRFGETGAESLRFYDRCFARHWPHRYHSFGWTEKTVLLRFPFHSADSSAWVSVPGSYRHLKVQGKWARGAGAGVAVDAVRRYLEVHIDDVLQQQAQIQARWGRTIP